MSPATSWTELTGQPPDWQKGIPDHAAGLVDFIFGDFVLTQPDFVSNPANWAHLSLSSATVGTELTTPATTWVELT